MEATLTKPSDVKGSNLANKHQLLVGKVSQPEQPQERPSLTKGPSKIGSGIGKGTIVVKQQDKQTQDGGRVSLPMSRNTPIISKTATTGVTSKIGKGSTTPSKPILVGAESRVVTKLSLEDEDPFEKADHVKDLMSTLE
jgi:hypothetical protein